MKHKSYSNSPELNIKKTLSTRCFQFTQTELNNKKHKYTILKGQEKQNKICICPWRKDSSSLVESCNMIAVAQASGCPLWGQRLGDECDKHEVSRGRVVLILSGIFVDAYRWKARQWKKENFNCNLRENLLHLIL